MASDYIVICPRRTFDFSGLGIGLIVIQTIRERIWVGNYRELTLMVRVHSKNFGSTGSIAISVANELWCPKDPALQFVTSVTPGQSLASVSVSSNAPTASPIPPGVNGFALGAGTTTSFGSHVRVCAYATGGSAVANLYADLSIALILKGT